MPNERAILCGNVSDSTLPFKDAKPIRLRMWGAHQNINLCIEDIQRPMLCEIPTQFLDILEIATYIYCADQAATRGGDGVRDFGENWRRRFFFRIPVRHPDLWNQNKINDLLRSTLGFLSDDEYLFDFTKLEKGPPLQTYLQFSDVDISLGNPEEVILFSGGIDSLGGAVQEAVVDKRKTVLVTHRSTQKLSRRHRRLLELLSNHSMEIPPLHFCVSVNKNKSLGKEYTQRSRSFLYAVLGATFAQMLGLSRIRFYENGIISLNLPLSAQVIGAKATRTTHPKVINGFAKIFSELAEKRFDVENPFIWKTKTDVVELIAKAGCEELIEPSTSCTHTWLTTNYQPHCGACSQCIDRRFSVLANGLEKYDEGYKVDLLTGERKEGEHRTMLAAYVETATEISKMKPIEFFARYGEVSRVLRHLEGSADSSALKIFELHQKHANQVTKVIDSNIAKYASDIRQRKLPSSCLLRMVCDASTLTPPGKIGDIADKGLPQNLKDYTFQKKGPAWIVRFASGKDFILLPSKGAAYLHILLSNPRTDFSVIDLVFQVAKKPNDFQLGNAGAGSDTDALSAYRAQYKNLKSNLEEAKKNDDLGWQEKIREEMEWLVKQIKRDQGLGGRLRKEADDRDRVRKSFRAAIRRAVDEIAKNDKALAEHLKSPRIKCGWNPCYDPYVDIEWDT